MEGKHNFTYMDVNGTCFGKRDGGKLLTTSTGELRVAIGKQTYFSTSTFLLDVTASNETVVTLKDDIVKHNLDKDTGDKEKSEMMYIILGLAVLGFISLICMALDKLSNPKQQ